MGGTSSAEEVSLCITSLFGKEMDSVSWDYGMLDGKDQWRPFLYAYRNAMRAKFPRYSSDPRDIPSCPAVLANHANFLSNAAFGTMERRGLTTLGMNAGWRDQAARSIPDSMEGGITQKEIDALPPMIQYFRCKGSETAGDCKYHKYNFTVCGKREYQANWHPGYKNNALDGNLMAFSYMEAMGEALEELARLEPKKLEKSKDDRKARVQKLFDELVAEEQSRYGAVLSGGFPGGRKNQWPKRGGFEYRDFANKTTFCHIARLPAEQRFRGFLTENFDLTTYNTNVDRYFDDGFLQDEVMNQEIGKGIPFVNPEPHRKNEFVLVHVQQEVCLEAPTYLDRKDGFLLSSLHGWRGLTLPNDSEKEYYNEFDAKNAKGWIHICLAGCRWGKCEKNDLGKGLAKPIGARRGNAAQLGLVEMTINGIEVAEYESGECMLLVRGDVPSNDPKRYEWPPNEKGRWELKARIVPGSVYSYVKFSSFIIM